MTTNKNKSRQWYYTWNFYSITVLWMGTVYCHMNWYNIALLKINTVLLYQKRSAVKKTCRLEKLKNYSWYVSIPTTLLIHTHKHIQHWQPDIYKDNAIQNLPQENNHKTKSRALRKLKWCCTHKAKQTTWHTRCEKNVQGNWWRGLKQYLIEPPPCIPTAIQFSPPAFSPCHTSY